MVISPTSPSPVTRDHLPRPHALDGDLAAVGQPAASHGRDHGIAAVQARRQLMGRPRRGTEHEVQHGAGLVPRPRDVIDEYRPIITRSPGSLAVERPRGSVPDLTDSPGTKRAPQGV
jgi:hypothetical protein